VADANESDLGSGGRRTRRRHYARLLAGVASAVVVALVAVMYASFAFGAWGSLMLVPVVGVSAWRLPVRWRLAGGLVILLSIGAFGPGWLGALRNDQEAGRLVADLCGTGQLDRPFMDCQGRVTLADNDGECDVAVTARVQLVVPEAELRAVVADRLARAGRDAWFQLTVVTDDPMTVEVVVAGPGRPDVRCP